MAYAKDLLILRDGSSIPGKVLKNDFRIKTSYADIKVKKELMVHLYFSRPDGSGFPTADEIKTNTGDEIRGTLVQTQTISFVRAADNQTERVHRDDIHSLLFLGLPDADA